MTIRAIKPGGDRAFILWLEAAVAEAASDLGTGIAWLPESLRNKLDLSLIDYRRAYDARQQLYGVRRQLVADRVAKSTALVQSLRLAFRTLKGMMIKGMLTPEQLDLYRLPGEAGTPNPNAFAAWNDVARRLLQGNAVATASGLPAIPLPGSDLIQAELDAAVDAAKAVTDAKKALKDNERERDRLKKETYQLWRAAARRLRDELDAATPAKRREEMRRYGYIFSSNSALGEASEASEIKEYASTGSKSTAEPAVSMEVPGGIGESVACEPDSIRNPRAEVEREPLSPDVPDTVDSRFVRSQSRADALPFGPLDRCSSA